jgi:hypothetical protein
MMKFFYKEPYRTCKEVIRYNVFHHKVIKKFFLEGQIHDESAIPRLKDEYIRLVNTEMKYAGYVPRLDLSPDFTIEYVEAKTIFKFKLTIYATYVGKKNSECILGIDGHTPIFIQKNKSNESLQAQESQ